MSLWQLLTIGVLVWISGLLFGAGWIALSPPQPRGHAQDSDGRWARSGMPLNIGNVLVWGLVGAGVAWAVAVVINEVAGSHVWGLTRAAYWVY